MGTRELTRELVSIPSHRGPDSDESEAGAWLADWLDDRTDATVERDDHGNVIARHGAGTELALIGHHDIVPPDESQVEDGEVVIEERDGRVTRSKP